MEDIDIQSDKYATKKSAEILADSLAQAYRDGYDNGYSEAKEGVAIEFIDLGLDSGTLWSASPLKEIDGESVLYLAYDDAIQFSIPTKEQWNELRENCSWECSWDDDPRQRVVKCIGPNGNYIEFNFIGHRLTTQSLYFRIHDNKEHSGEQRLAASINRCDARINTEKKSFVFPVRLAIRGR